MLPLRLAVIAALAVLLSACWGSDYPLMPANSTLPVPLGTTLRHPIEDDASEYVRLAHDGQGRLVMQNMNSPGDPPYLERLVSFDHLFGVWYLVQRTQVPSSYSSDQRAEYAIIDVHPNYSMHHFEPGCGPEETALPGVIEADGDCKFSNYDSLRRAAYARATRLANGEGSAVVTGADSYFPP